MEKYNLKTTDINFKWIVKMVDIDAKHQLKKAPHLSKAILDMGKNTYSKMKVGPAMKVLSRATASSLRWFHEKYPEEFTYECLTMAKFCEMVGYWFEICAGRNQFLAFHRDDPEKTAQKIDFLKEFIGFYST